MTTYSYGLLCETYLKTHRRIIYINLLTAGTLHEHLMRQMAAAQGITEALKAADQMAWVGAMNNIKACAEEIVLKEMVYA